MKILLLCGLILISQSAYSVYNANMSGVVKDVLTYVDKDLILFRLSNQSSTHPGCKRAYFAIDPSIPAQRRASLLARLLSAHATQKATNIGYDDSVDCASGYIRVHRVG